MKKIIAALIGIVYLTIPIISLATDVTDYYRSVIDIPAGDTQDAYIRFGNETYPGDLSYGIEIDVIEESAASQWVNIDVTILDGAEFLIFERNISKFYVLANGKIIDFFYPQWEATAEGELIPISYYTIKPSTTHLIGTDVKFQVVGIEDNGAAQYVVAWSNVSDTLRFDPLPVSDEISQYLLSQILSKLGDIYNKLDSIETKLSSLLEKIANEIATMFTPTQEASDRLEQAAKDLYNKTPMGQMERQNQAVHSTFTDSIERLEDPVSRLTFGEKRDWFMIGKEVYLIDLTGLEEQVKLMRDVLEAIIWIEFFVFLLFYLSPKLDI